MDAFSYVMTLVAIIVGLGIAHILSGIGQAIHRLRGHGAPIRLEAVYLYWVGNLFIWLISFWWWEYKFSKIDIAWSLGLYLFIVTYAMFLYLTALILVPSRMEEMHDSYEYFMSGRKWFFAFMMATNLIDVADTFLKGTSWGLRPIFVAQVLVTAIAFVVGATSNRRSVQVVIAVIVLLYQFFYNFSELATLGAW